MEVKRGSLSLGLLFCYPAALFSPQRVGLLDRRQMLGLWAGNVAPKDILTLSQESAKETLRGEALLAVFVVSERTFPQRYPSPPSY